MNVLKQTEGVPSVLSVLSVMIVHLPASALNGMNVRVVANWQNWPM